METNRETGRLGDLRMAALALLLVSASTATTAIAGEGAEEAGGTGGQSLDSKATDPTAALTYFTFTEIMTLDHWGSDRGDYALRFRPAIPFKVWNIDNILRVSLAFDHGGVHGYGLEDVQVFDLLVFPLQGGRIGFGPFINLASEGSATPSPFAIGPAVGYVHSTDALNLGFFSQNAFGDEYAISFLQPILTWHFARNLDLGPGDLQYTYDWEADHWVSLPLGVQLGCLANVAKQPMRFYADYQFNFNDLSGTPKNTVQLGMVLMVP